MIHLSARQLNFSVHFDDDKWNSFRASASTQKHCWFLRHLLFLQVETLPYRHEILRWDSLSLWWIHVSEWVLGVRSLFLIILLNHLPQETQILHLFGLSGLPSHSVFCDMFLMHLTFPILQSQQSEYLLHKFPSREQSMSKKDSPNLPSFWDFPSCRSFGPLADSNSISKNPITTHHPIQIAIIRLMSLLLLDVQLLLQFRFVFERWSVIVRWFHDNSSQYLPNSSKLYVWVTFGFCDGFENFRKFFSVSCEVLVLHGFHWVAKTCTTTAYRWLFRDSRPSLRIVLCCCQVTILFCAQKRSLLVFAEESMNTVLLFLCLHLWSNDNDNDTLRKVPHPSNEGLALQALHFRSVPSESEFTLSQESASTSLQVL